MNKKYYISLVCAFIICSILPGVVYFSSFDDDNDKKQIKTTYLFENVDGPIQPIPRQLTIDKEWLILGKALFNSPLLSKNNTISCGSCHIQKFGFSDTARFSRGFEGGKTSRHSMALVNSRYYVSGKFFWDERSRSLEEQVSQPILDHIEMGMQIDSVVNRLIKVNYYPQLFNYAFGSNEIDSVKISKALSQFVRSMISFNSKYFKIIVFNINIEIV